MAVILLNWCTVAHAKSEVTSYFEERLEVINIFLEKNHKKAVNDPQYLVQFVDKELLNVWSAKNTLRAMLGPKRWSSMKPKTQSKLVLTYQNTIRRYLYETLNQFKGQEATVVGLRLNPKGNKGWLSVSLETPNLPDLTIDLKIYKSKNTWTVYDFSFQGISFVKLKRVFFRQTFDQKGAEGLIKTLNHKNKKFNQIIAAE
ncbi:MlaC/ttg2D family ABC transporter substrate-binding protein [Kangiella sediminilitoris]|nr:ABC transporter substrate-binding protein [Kangiella sediminilitoris]